MADCGLAVAIPPNGGIPLLPPLLASPGRKLVKMEKHVCGILENPHRAGALELVLAVAAREKPDSEGSAAGRCIHVPDAVADDVGTLRPGAEPARRLDEQVRVGFGVA